MIHVVYEGNTHTHNMHTHTHAYTQNIHAHTHIHVHIHKHSYTHTVTPTKYTHTHTHTYTHTHTHTRTHTHTQVLLDDFSSCGGYKFLFQYLLHLERMATDDARDAERNLVLLTSSLVLSGFLSLEPTLNDGGPFQDSGFSVPVPIGNG